MQKVAVVLPSEWNFSNPVVNGAGLQQIEVDLSLLNLPLLSARLIPMMEHPFRLL